ncbi:aldo/keto reductase [Limisalsivibrio acetivorans]|uniref:aldo/keto reductase n=1 Tax=Limisalsivibrio acetivorans TaxID=1304888 RepID=UPI0003B476C7|nr:aldo/keto reductase [Limisalsivibrio acetivorans]
MERRKLGTQGLVVSKIGLGCMGMSEFYGKGDDSESIKVIHEALERGLTFLDTADMYGNGANEELVGKAVKGRRDSFEIATKFGIVRSEDPTKRSICGRPEYVKEACEKSLKRLNIDTIDLYYNHRKDPEVEIEETVGAMAELVKEGKVRYLGLSEMGAETLRRAYKVHPITALQSEYSLWTRDIEGEILDTCRELGIGIVPYSPLGRGFLTGAIKSQDSLDKDDFRRQNPRFSEESMKANLKLVEKVEKIAGEIGCTPAQLALAWVIAKGEDMVPIPGTKKIKYLKDNIGAAKLSLSSEIVKTLDEAIDPNEVKGLRYDAQHMKILNS